ncbi:hypothetical protein HMPREF1569_3702, partial [Klebsiella oxytoca OK-1]
MCKDVPWAYNQRQDGSPASPPGNSVTFCALLPGAALCALPVYGHLPLCKPSLHFV